MANLCIKVFSENIVCMKGNYVTSCYKGQDNGFTLGPLRELGWGFTKEPFKVLEIKVSLSVSVSIFDENAPLRS